jgi:hypothetical protein
MQETLNGVYTSFILYIVTLIKKMPLPRQGQIFSLVYLRVLRRRNNLQFAAKSFLSLLSICIFFNPRDDFITIWLAKTSSSHNFDIVERDDFRIVARV